MRKIFAVTAIALLAFAGQAMASEGVASLAPDLGQIGYADADGGAGAASGEVFYADIFGALLLVGGLIMVVTSKNHTDLPLSA
jgi:hypothetical protein